MLESEAIPVHFEDVDMVGEAIEERSGKPFRAKDLGPLVEGQIDLGPQGTSGRSASMQVVAGQCRSLVWRSTCHPVGHV